MISGENSSKKDINILVIDDEQGIRDLIKSEFGDLGYSVTVASDGFEGIEKLKKKKMDIVISDVQMPKSNGIQVLKAVKELDPTVEVIMMTGFGTIEKAVEAMKIGAYDFVQKPFNLDQLHSLIKGALERTELKGLVTLYEASKAIFSAVRLEHLLPILVDLSVKLLRAENISIMLMGQDHKLYVAASSQGHTEELNDVRLTIGERVAGKVAEWKESTIINGPLENDSRFNGISSKPSIKSSLICPLLSKSGVLGVLCATRTKETHLFNYFDRRYADILCTQISQAVENAHLYDELHAKMEALNQAYTDLTDMQQKLLQSEKLASIGELASGIAHELNNPLTAVIGLVDLLIEDEPSKSEKKQDLFIVKEQSMRCSKIVTNLLQFARQNKIQKKPFQINEIIEKTLELTQYELRTSGVDIIKELDHTIGKSNVDPQQLEQVFLNIINNARFALKNQKSPRLLIKTQLSENKVVICFADNGTGIPKGILHKIFDPFYTTKEVNTGTGLGLSVSYGIIKDHGGIISVDSIEGEGTEFYIEIPVIC